MLIISIQEERQQNVGRGVQEGERFLRANLEQLHRPKGTPMRRRKLPDERFVLFMIPTMRVHQPLHFGCGRSLPLGYLR